MQFISFTGHLTADPTARATNNGASVASFTVGVTRSHKNQNGDRESDFFRVTAWRQQADFCSKYLTKGMKVFVRGELQPSIFEGKDGKARLSLDVQADAVEILSEKQKDQKKELEGFTDISSDDLPFGR
jgi:single-strand DNA-binding protein